MLEALTDADAELAQTLRSNRRKINSLLAAADAVPTDDADAGAPSRKFGVRWRKSGPRRQKRSAVEDYRLARQIARVIQALCAGQIACTLGAAALHDAPPLPLLVCVAAFCAGGAASYARVQRHEALTAAANVAYVAASLGAPFELLNAIYGAGEEHFALFQIAVAALASAVCMAGVVVGAYALYRPLRLYRYESVAADEESADRRSIADETPRRPGEGPMDEWYAGVGEVGVPLVCMPVRPSAPARKLAPLTPRPTASVVPHPLPL